MRKIRGNGAVTKLAKGFFKTNKIRNIFAIIGIVLTTVMFTIIFTVGMSMKQSMEESMMRQVGGKAHVSLKYISEEQYNNVQKSNLIKESGLSIPLGIAENEKLIKYPNEIKYATEKQAEFNFAKPTEGHMPEKYNEIAMDTGSLDALGISHGLGQEIELEYTLNNEKIKENFILSGTWIKDKVITSSQIWISKEYIDSKLKNYVAKNPKDVIGEINLDIMFKNTFNMESKVMNLIISSGYDVNDINYGINWAYLGSKGDMDLTVLVAVVGVISLIILCGYLIIYNIFFICISKDIKFYGLLKIVGTTSKQIKSIVIKEALILSAISAPIGLIFGYIIGRIITPIVLNETDILIESISVSPIIFIGAVLFSILTVIISVMKPAKMAGKVSAIEALNNNEGISNKNKISNKKIKGNSYKMALANIFNSNKKIVVITLSLSLSLIILNLTYIIVNSFDMDTYLSKKISTDFIIGDSAYFNSGMGYNEQQTLSKDIIQELQSLDGIKEYGYVKFLENNYNIDSNTNNLINSEIDNNLECFPEQLRQEIKSELKDQQLISHIYGINKAITDKLKLNLGVIDYDKFKSGNYVIVSTNDQKQKITLYKPGDKVVLNNKDNIPIEYEVMAVANVPEMLSVRHVHSFNLGFFMSEEVFNEQYKDVPLMIITLDVEKDKQENIESYIEEYSKNDNKIAYESKNLFEKEFNSTKRTYWTVGMLLSFIIALIGIMNFTNTIITSVILRKRELAMLQSIGMTRVQMQKMLRWEGIIYSLITASFVLTIGVIINYLIGRSIISSIWFLKFNFTIIPIVICLPILFIIAIIIPSICYKYISKLSIIERLREIE